MQLASDVAAFGLKSQLHAFRQLMLGFQPHVVIDRFGKAVGHAVERAGQAPEFRHRKNRQTRVETAATGTVERRHDRAERTQCATQCQAYRKEQRDERYRSPSCDQAQVVPGIEYRARGVRMKDQRQRTRIDQMGGELRVDDGRKPARCSATSLVNRLW